MKYTDFLHWCVNKLMNVWIGVDVALHRTERSILYSEFVAAMH
jgi:hypothetical protein